MSEKRMSRRQMLRGLGLAAVGAAAAACQPKTVIIKETVEVEKEKIVTQVVTQVVEVEKEVTKIVAGTSVVEKVVETKVVEKVVEKVVTATPVPMEAPEIWIAATSSCHGGEEATAQVRQHIYDQTNIWVNTQLLPAGASQEKLNLLLASGTQLLDHFEGRWTDYKGMITPLNDLFEQYGQNILKNNKDVNWAMMKDWEGTTWGHPRLGIMGHTHWCYHRTDWLDEVGMEMPDTIEEMEEAVVAFKGAHPESVVGGRNINDLEMNTLGAFTEYGKSRWVDPADNMLKPHYLQPGYMDFLTFFNRWWNEGWFHGESFAGPDWRAVLKTLSIGLWLGWYSRITLWWGAIRQDAGYEKEDYSAPIRMMGPEGLAKTNNAGSNAAYMIPRKSKVADAVVRYIDWIYEGLPDDATNLLTVWVGLEGDTWKWVDKEGKTIQWIYDRASVPLDERYGCEYWEAKGMGTEPKYFAITKLSPEGEAAPVPTASYFAYDYMEDYSSGKMPLDFDVPYDNTLIKESFPGLADMDRLVNEETIKFITGIRPLSEWSAFLGQLEDAGLQTWVDLYTEQYRQYHP